jgi:hypothetical protein
MPFDRVIQRALRDIHSLLMANIALPQNLSDERTMICLRATTSKLEIKEALDKANDTASCFALREVMHVLADRQPRPRATIDRLWEIVRQPEFDSAFADEKGPRPIPWWKKPPTD